MKSVPVLARVLDCLRVTRRGDRPASSAVRTMSDRELALAISELKLTPTKERAKQNGASAIAELRRFRHSLDEEDACTAQRANLLHDGAVKLLRDPAPDTFLGRKTQEPFPEEDKE